jgi:hypothetical protein
MPTPTQDLPGQLVERPWPDPVEGPFRLRLWVKQVEDRPAIVGVEMWGSAPVGSTGPSGALFDGLPDTPITRKDINLALARLLDGWLVMMGSYARAARTVYADVPGQEANVTQFEQHLGIKHAGRPRLSDEFLKTVADIYKQAVHEGDSGPALQVQLKLNAATVETARGWIRQARKRGFLEPYTRKGKGA